MILFSNGYGEGGHIEEGRNDMPLCVPVGTHMLHAVGLGWAMKYRKTGDRVMTVLGAGATSEGDFHEAANFAGVFVV